MLKCSLAALASACLIVAAEVPRELAPDDAVRLALENRAEVDAARARVEAREGDALQASLRPNPTFSFQSENWRAWGDPSLNFGRDMNIFLSASQTIETGGKRRLRSEQADAASEAARLEAEVFRWAVRAETLDAYERARLADSRLALLDRSVAVARELARYHRVRFEEGAGSELDFIRVQTALHQVQADQQAAAISAEQARFALFQAMGLARPSEPVNLIASEPAAAPPPIPNDGPLHPQMRLAAARLEQARRAERVAAAAATPNVTPYLGYKRDGPFNTLIGGVSVPLTVSNRNQGGRASAAAQVRQAEAEMRATGALLTARVDAAQSAWGRSASLLESLQSGAVNRAAEAYRIVFAAYQEDAVPLTDVLVARRTQTETELLLVEAHGRYRLARRAYEAALGRPLPEVQR